MTTTQERQAAAAVLMVRPACFYGNPETRVSNHFQREVARSAHELLSAARAEFDRAAEALEAAGVEVLRWWADPAADTPDAIFPNNWFSTHADGRLVLYPMAVPSRRLERRPEALCQFLAQHGYGVTSIADLTALESEGRIVEGTGSLVLDREARIAYAARSPRTHPDAVTRFSTAMGYQACLFTALDGSGREIYHTNVLMSVGPTLAIVALDLLPDQAERQRVHASLTASGRTLLEVSATQIEAFAGNALFLQGARGPAVALSRRAFESLDPAQRTLLERHAAPIVCAVDLIEDVGGGGIRCMLAEIFLPRRNTSA
jgi:hypothetical protein